MRVAANIAGTARARADIVQRFFHRGDDLGVLAHAEIIIRAPHGDQLWTVMPGKTARVGVSAFVTQYVDEHAVTAFGVQPVNRFVEY